VNAKVATREKWLAARVELLEQEKELTRRNDELARRRRELPWVRIDKEYLFETHGGVKTLAELFDGRSQLIIYHFMHGPNTPEGCEGCTFATDNFNGAEAHLNAHDVTFLLASRSPLETLNAYKERMGWTIPWVSSGGSDFNATSPPGPRRTAATARAGTSGRRAEQGSTWSTTWSSWP